MAMDTQSKQRAEGKQKIESKPIVENKTEVDPPRKSLKRWILIGSVVLLIVVGGLGYLAYPYIKGSRNSGVNKKAGAYSIHERVKAILSLDPFLVNLADANESRFLKTTFQLGLAEDLEEEGKDSISIAAMRDSIITLLSSKTAEQILTSQGKDKLREEIRSRVNAISPKIKVVEVYIVDFVVQL
jgi:flagellar FliL protein